MSTLTLNTLGIRSLLRPERLWTREEVLARPSPVPCVGGVYAWYFKEMPPGVPADGCTTYAGCTLLYVGISSKATFSDSSKPSRQMLFHRLRDHMRGNAEGSTLRLTLGCLLAQQLSIQLRRVGNGRRLTFAKDEAILSDWLSKNALVTWCVHPDPQLIEEELIQTVSLPLNLDQNGNHPFHTELSAIRRQARATARSLPIVEL